MPLQRICLALAAIAALLASASSAMADWTKPPTGYAYAQLSVCPKAYKRYLACADQMAIFNTAARKARDENRKLLVVFGADWCPWCRVIDGELPKAEMLEHPELKGKVEVVLIALNVKEGGKKYTVPSGQAVEDMLKARMVADKPQGFVPFFTVVDPKVTRAVVGLGNGRFAEVVDNKAGYLPENFRRAMLESSDLLGELATAPNDPRKR